MKSKILLFSLAMIFALEALQAQNAAKSIVHLKNGKLIQCDIIGWQNDTIKVKTPDGTLFAYSMKDVDKISNASVSNDNNTANNAQETTRYKIRRSGRDLYIGNKGIDDASIHILLGNKLYNQYRSGYSKAGLGGFFIATAIASTALGIYWCILGENSSIKTRGYVCCGAACVILPIGCTLRHIGKKRIDWVVDEYNHGRYAADIFNVSPGIFQFNDIATGNQTYALGATLKFSF